MNSFLIYSPDSSKFELSPDHPFRPERTQMMYDLCMQYDLFDRDWINIIEPAPLTSDELLLFHAEAYLETLDAAGKSSVDENTLMAGLGTPDCPIFPDMFDRLNLVSGGTIVGMRRVMESDGRAYAFNPIGGFHHAYPDHAEGFCYINDLAVAGKLLRRDGLRFAYIDIDAHHGNGVEHGFYDDDGALVISIHQSGRTLYPGTGFETEFGTGKGRGYTINVPVPPGTDDELYLKAFFAVVPPALEAFSPDVLIIQIGTDSMHNDPLTNLSLTNNSYKRIAEELSATAVKVIATGGGGYNLDNATRGWALAWAAFNDIPLENPYAGIIGGVMGGPDIEMGDLTDRPIYITGPTKTKNTYEIDRIIEYIHAEIFPLIGAKP